MTTVHQVGNFPVVMHSAEEGGYWVECPVVEGCYSQGETIEEALRNIREAVLLSLQDVPRARVRRLVENISLHSVAI